MRRMGLAAALALVLDLNGCSTLPPGSDEGAIRDAARRFDAAFADDAMLAAEIPPQPMAVRAGQPQFIDRFAPFSWQTAPAWLDGDRNDRARRDISERRMTVLAFRRVRVDRGRFASVVVKARLDYVEHGEPAHETGTQLLLMRKDAGNWKLEGYGWFGAGAVEQGPEAEAALSGARQVVDMLNARYVIPRTFVDYGAIEDNSIDDWKVRGETPEQEAATHGPVAPGDPDAMFVLGPPGRLVTAQGGAYVLFPATIASRSGGPAKAKGTLVMNLIATSNMWIGLNQPWTYFDHLAWIPD